jgi:hypothetical protein
VIDVCVREENVLHRQPVAVDDIEEFLRFIARVDDDRLGGLVSPQDVAVLEERRDGTRLEQHGSL